VAGSADAIARVGGTVAGVVLNERRPAERFRRRRDRKRRRRRTRRSRKKAEPQVRVLPRGQTPDAARPSAVGSATEPFARP
jgi:hypothetical protein